MRFAKALAFLAMLGWFTSTAPVTQAAAKVKRAKPAVAVQAITGTVVKHHGKKPVAGAHVHLAGARHARHRKHTTVTKTSTTPTATKSAKSAKKTIAALRAARAAKRRPAVAGHAHGTITDANGNFSLVSHGKGSKLVVAHKKHVGKGHARATAGASVVIRLHKHHHHHAAVVPVAGAAGVAVPQVAKKAKAAKKN